MFNEAGGCVTRIRRVAIGILMMMLVLRSAPGEAQSSPSWSTLSQHPPGSLSFCLLLTDATVMCQSGNSWYRLTPSNTGSYLTGTWSTLASFPNGFNPDSFASAVLADGRVAVIGGEYVNGSFVLGNLAFVYSPTTNSWQSIGRPISSTSPDHWQCIGDAPSVMMADGRWLVGSKLYQDLAILDPVSLTWSSVSAPGKIDPINSEEGWTLLPDGSVFTADVTKAPLAERLVLTKGALNGSWVSAGTTPVDLHTPSPNGPITAYGCPTYTPPGEMGPTLLLPNGKVFVVGANGATALYTPPAAGSPAPGSWVAGPSLPAGLNVQDGPGVVLPSGKALIGASPGASGTGLQYFESDGTTLTSVPAPATASSDSVSWTSLLPLPTGQVLLTDYTSTVQIYTPAAFTPNPAWVPTISTVQATLATGQSYVVYGTQFNGLTQASAYGDELQNAVGYPLVRITNNATRHVFYARTHNHSTMAVATGSTPVSTTFDITPSIETGASTLQVIANGLASNAMAVTIQPISTATTLSLSTSASVYGQSVTLTGKVAAGTSIPSGAITFTNGTTVLGTVAVNSAGQSTLTTSALPVGTATLLATYTGATGYATSTSSALSDTVGQAATTTLLSSSNNTQYRGYTVTFTATVVARSPSTAIPSGTVIFKDGSATLGTATLNSTGQATLSTTKLATGTHIITAVYAGNTNLAYSLSTSLSQQIR